MAVEAAQYCVLLLEEKDTCNHANRRVNEHAMSFMHGKKNNNEMHYESVIPLLRLRVRGSIGHGLS